MQAIRIHRFGGPEVMQLDEVPLPLPAAAQVLVRVQAASVNFFDIVQRRGDHVNQAFYTREANVSDTFPQTLGQQGVGLVEQIGAEVKHVKVGDRVVFYGNSYATYAVAPANRVIPVPDGLTLEQAAAGYSQGFIAYELTHAAYPVKPADWCLVQAAAGGVGLFLVQMIKLRGGRVIGVTSNQAKAQAVRDAGADAVIISGESDIAQESRRLTDGKGVNVVYDGVGKDTFEAGLNSLAPRGYMMVYGQASGYVPPFDIMQLQEKGSLFLSRNSAAFYFEQFGLYAHDFVAWVQSGKLKVQVDKVYPLAEAADAHAAMEARQTIGRVLLEP